MTDTPSETRCPEVSTNPDGYRCELEAGHGGWHSIHEDDDLFQWMTPGPTPTETQAEARADCALCDGTGKVRVPPAIVTGNTPAFKPCPYCHPAPETQAPTAKVRDHLAAMIEAMEDDRCLCSSSRTDWPEATRTLREAASLIESMEARVESAEEQLNGVLHDREVAEAQVARLREAVQRIYDELGEPTDLDYPAPVANAARIARAALTNSTSGEQARGDCEFPLCARMRPCCKAPNAKPGPSGFDPAPPPDTAPPEGTTRFNVEDHTDAARILELVARLAHLRGEQCGIPMQAEIDAVLDDLADIAPSSALCFGEEHSAALGGCGEMEEARASENYYPDPPPDFEAVERLLAPPDTAPPEGARFVECEQVGKLIAAGKLAEAVQLAQDRAETVWNDLADIQAAVETTPSPATPTEEGARGDE